MLNREVLLAFWKVHILCHASEKPLYGQWMLRELRHHGYEVSPGTLYPILHRMARLGWIQEAEATAQKSKARKLYTITPLGTDMLDIIRHQLAELLRELPPASADSPTQQD